MIYMIYEEKNLIVETDSLDFVKSVARNHPGCLIKETKTGKVYKASYRRKNLPQPAVKTA